MIKKSGALLVICCFLLAALPNAAPAAQSLSRQSLVKKNIAGLQAKLLSAASDDSTPLHSLTIQFLDDLRLNGFKNNANLELAVMQYVADIQEQTTAAALDPTCSPALLISITLNGTNMVEELASYDTPACEAISLSTSAASIISAKYSYDICVIDNTAPVDEAARAALVTKQTGIKYFSFFADVLNLAICTPGAGAQDYVTLLIRFIGLFMQP